MSDNDNIGILVFGGLLFGIFGLLALVFAAANSSSSPTVRTRRPRPLPEPKPEPELLPPAEAIVALARFEPPAFDKHLAIKFTPVFKNMERVFVSVTLDLITPCTPHSKEDSFTDLTATAAVHQELTRWGLELEQPADAFTIKALDDLRDKLLTIQPKYAGVTNACVTTIAPIKAKGKQAMSTAETMMAGAKSMSELSAVVEIIKREFADQWEDERFRDFIESLMEGQKTKILDPPVPNGI